MYLKALEIQGFKSFADKTRLTFEKDITAIVGPNGSGKSNISDALLWVMGEQRSKALRGSKMEDVIFGGTEKRSPLGFAQVSLVLDNSNHTFDYDGSEIMLTRRYYRSGDSEYYINREAVRLKDINSLLMDTGLGRDGYSIIGQGRIAEIISTKSTDRREIFEEAAGISRYRYRKEEAERKLEKTEENLLRVNDKIEELEMQVGPLKKQSETAKKYLKLRDELKVREISAWMESLDKLKVQAAAVKQEYDQLASELDKSKSSLEALYTSSGSITERMHQKDIEAEHERERLSEQETLAAACAADASALQAGADSTENNVKRMLSEIADAENRAGEVQSRISDGEGRISEISEELKKINEELNSNNNVIDGCRMKLKSREAAVNDLNARATQLSIDLRSMDSRINMLSEMEKEFEGFSKAVKTVMREAQRGNLRGVHGPVANLVRTDDECALAIETALGAAAQNIVIDSQNDGRAAIEMLKRMDSGRATFLPIDTIRATVMRDAPERDPGFVGVAYDLVKFDSRYEQIFANLLGRTVIAETLGDAVRISKNNGNRYRIVTLDGQLINAGGSMTGGSSAKGTGVISRANELEKLRKKRVKLAENEKSCTLELERARQSFASVRYQLDTALEDQADIRGRLSSLETEQRTTAASVRQLKILFESMTGDSEARRESVESAQKNVEALRAQHKAKLAELAVFNARAENIRADIKRITDEKLELEGRRTNAEKEAQRKNTEIIDLERRLSRAEQKKTSADFEEKQYLDKLWDNYELSYSTAVSLRQPIENLSKENRAIAELRREINSLGSPNIGAIEEYERVNTRYEFLTGQRDDVEKAKKELLDIINDITSEMKEIFVTKFKEINESFHETFLELFGGGKAALQLDDENNVLECGIEIKVQPPGKALSNINLLSGGEKAFVAIALYFAIMKVRPTPFCVMDEIEAALDEANVTRYADYMRRMSDKTQFLVITHRRGTMDEADMLYGVTMQEKGVSTVIELDLENARKTIEE